MWIVRRFRIVWNAALVWIFGLLADWKLEPSVPKIVFFSLVAERTRRAVSLLFGVL